MKKIFLFLFVALFSQVIFAYTWNSFDFPGTKANKLVFVYSDNGFASAFVCSDSGVYFTQELWNPVWEFYEIPFVDAAPFDDDNLLVVFDDGSYSDGIYKFNLTDKEFNVVKFCAHPHFIERASGVSGNPQRNYLVGYEGGLLISEDGENWEEKAAFQGKDCLTLQGNRPEISSHLALLTGEQDNNTYVSDDAGESWEVITSDFALQGLIKHDMQMSGISYAPGTLPAAFYTYEEGEWVHQFSSDFTVFGYDNGYRPAFGWKYSNSHQGVAIYSGDNLMFLNEGLPDLNINYITTVPPAYCGNAIYVCTDGGIYYTENYLGTTDEQGSHWKLTVYPNPASATLVVTMPDNNFNGEISIYSIDGKLAKKMAVKHLSNPVEIDIRGIKAGVYIIEAVGERQKWVNRFICK